MGDDRPEKKRHLSIIYLKGNAGSIVRSLRRSLAARDLLTPLPLELSLKRKLDAVVIET